MWTTLALSVSAGMGSAQVSRLGDSFPVIPPVTGVRFEDVAYDSVNDVYLAVTGPGTIRGRFIRPDGTFAGDVFQIDSLPGNYTQCPSVAFNPTTGTFLVAWHDGRNGGRFPDLFARALMYSGGVPTFLSTDTQMSTPGVGTWWEARPGLAFSTVSQNFLVAWRQIDDAEIHAVMVSANGAPLNVPFAVTQDTFGENNPVVTYNPATDQFLVGYDGWAPSYNFAETRWVQAGATGAPVGTPLRVINSANANIGVWAGDAAFNSVTGKSFFFFVHYGFPFGVLGQRYNADGTPDGAIFTASTYYYAYDAVSVAYNPVSNTFALATHVPGNANPENAVVELHQDGTPVDNGIIATAIGGTGNFNPQIAAQTNAAKWLLVTSNQFTSMWGQFIQTATRETGGPPPPPPPSLAKSAPANGAMGQSTASVTLTWGTATGATDYQYCVNTTNDTACGGGWTSVGTATSVALTNLMPGVTYYWQARATVNGSPLAANNGTWWTFATQVPMVASFADFNNNGAADLVWRNAVTGQNSVWFMSGTTVLSEVPLPSQTDTRWQIVAVGDFNGDAKPDLVWRNSVTGLNVIWFMNGPTFLSQASLPAVADTAWQIVAAGDLNGDGKPDLVWRNSTSGLNSVWYMNGTTVTGQVGLPAVADASWRIVGAGDFNHDGYADLLWRNSLSGMNVVWYMNNGQFQSQVLLPPETDCAWTVGQVVDLNGDGQADIVWRNARTGVNAVWFMTNVSVVNVTSIASAGVQFRLPGPSAGATSDLDGNGSPDIVWRNATTGQNVIWYMAGTTQLTPFQLLPAVPDTAWQMTALADFNADGWPDILWRNATTGLNVIWLMQGANFLSQVLLPMVPDPQWDLVAAADMDGDGKPDLIWRNGTTGLNVVWLMNGTTFRSQVLLPIVPNVAWKLVAAADMDGDGKTDLVWRNTTNGMNVIWKMDGTTFVSQTLLPTVATTAWQIVQAADFDRDGNTDLLWRNYTTGENRIWIMQGMTKVSELALPVEPDLNWKVLRSRN